VEQAAGEPLVAKATLERGLEKTGQSGLLLLQYAALLEASGDVDGAIDAYSDVVARFPNAVVAANNLAMLLATHRTDQASLDRALELASPFADRDSAALVDTLGWVHHVRGEFDQAQPFFDRAVATLPENPGLNYHAGLNLIELGRPDDARKHLAIAANAEGFSMREAAAEALGKLGDG
jgi:tetratricopeptide (TPR) repeat protein